MSRTLVWSTLVASLSYIVWTRAPAFRNTVLPTPDLPVGYYSGGAHEQQCNVIHSETPEEMKFCEDVRFWDKVDKGGTVVDRVLILTCDPGRLAWNTVMGPLANPNPRGALWLYDPKISATPHRINFVNYPDTYDLHPLGFDISHSTPGKLSNLFVTNHGRNRSTVEQFTLSWDARDSAKWVRTLSSPQIVSPNAIALTSPTSFYLTQDHHFTRRLPGILGQILPVVESVLAIPLAWVTHISVPVDPASLDDVDYAVATTGVPFANGIDISPGNGELVAVASSSTAQVFFYERDPQTNALTLAERIPIPFAVDNVSFDKSGALLIAGHPDFPALVAVARNVSTRAPSWVLALTPRTQSSGAIVLPKEFDMAAPVSASRKVSAVGSYEFETLYQSNGTAFTSSSSGLRDDITGILYVTGLYEEGLLVCRPT